MSLNIVDSLLNKFPFTSKEINIPFGKKLTGSQNFLGTNQCLSQSIPTEFLTPFMDNEYFSVDHTKMNRSNSLDSKMNNIFHYFDPTNDRLVGRVSKLLSPMLSSHGPLRIVPNYLEIFRDQELMKQGFKLLCEEVENHFEKMNKKQLDSKVGSNTNSSTSAESYPKKTNLKNLNSIPVKVSHQANTQSVESPTNVNKEINLQVKSKKDIYLQPGLTVSVEITTSPNEVLNSDKNPCHQANMSAKSPSKSKMSQQLSVPHVSLQEDSKKPLTNNNQTLNEELTNRKNKELQKRSRNRRRRQKKNSQNKDCKAKGNILKPPNTSNAGPSNSHSDKNTKGSDIFYDIVRNGVQILLPNSSSLVISIESAEDDSDWDSNADCERLSDCSEFEFSGIFISNLSTPLSNGVCFSQLSVESSPNEEIEMHHLGKVLRRVNENWVKAMKELDTKPKVASKVSFAPDDELVEIFYVEVFDRKGEWETFTTERMRFKRRIDELEKILSPCLSIKHRRNILSRFQKSDFE